MAKRKLQRFAENDTFPHFFQPNYKQLFDGYEMKGRWAEVFFKNQNPITLELGCGKGEFTTGLAARYPERNFIGIDINNLSLMQILGSVFALFAWVMGIPLQDIHVAGGLMGTKMVINEFVAYMDLSLIRDTLTDKTILITSFALCGFANFSSIAIQVGGIGELVPERRTDLARLGFKALICGTLASYLSATIAGILM